MIAIFRTDAPEKSLLVSRWLVTMIAQRAHDVRHLECSDGRLCPLVSSFGAGALDGLLDAVGGEYTEYHRHSARRRDLTAAACRRAGDVFEMRSRTANHATQCDDRAHLARTRQPLA